MSETKHKPNYKRVGLSHGWAAIIDQANSHEIVETFSPNIHPNFIDTRYTELWKQALGIK